MILESPASPKSGSPLCRPSEWTTFFISCRIRSVFSGRVSPVEDVILTKIMVGTFLALHELRYVFSQSIRV